jgi:hypothetical protein
VDGALTGTLTGSGSHAPDPTWQGAAMIRHVVVFTWSDAADAGRRAATVEALRGLREDVGGMSSLVVAEDAGLADGNGDAVLIADFPDVEAYQRYAQDPVHQSVLAEHVRPWLAARAAVQYRI